MALQNPSVQQTSSVQHMENLLVEAMRIADLHGYGLTAIRIEEAVMAIHDRDAQLSWNVSTSLN